MSNLLKTSQNSVLSKIDHGGVGGVVRGLPGNYDLLYFSRLEQYDLHQLTIFGLIRWPRIPTPKF